MISIKALEFCYRNSEFQLKIPELIINNNEKVAVIGASGAGKTTLLKLISGLVVPKQGSVCVENQEISQFTDKKRRAFRIKNVGFIFQDFELLEYLTVEDNILHPYRISSNIKLTKAVRTRAIQLAAELGIEHKLKNNINDLSQGERQRAAICRALLVKPKILLADEATGNLDPKNKYKIIEKLIETVDAQNSNLIAVTHDHELLCKFDRVIDFDEFCNTGIA